MNVTLFGVAWSIMCALAGIGMWFIAVSSGWIGQIVFGG